MPAIPMHVLITPFSEKGEAETASWTCSYVVDAVNAANVIWKKAALQFAVKDCTVDTPIDLPKGSRDNDQRVLDVLSFRRPATGLVTVFLISAQTNLTAGGSSYLNSDPEASCFVQWYGKTEANGRALAHELGHLLGLDHVKVNYSDERSAARQIGNLMVEGLTMGTDLAPGQIQSAKGSKLAKKFGA
jgi:hypothetical protein